MEIAGYPLRRLRARVVEGIDPPLFALALALAAIGLAALYSASYENASRVAGQLGNLALALTAMWAVARERPQFVEAMAKAGALGFYRTARATLARMEGGKQ